MLKDNNKMVLNESFFSPRGKDDKPNKNENVDKKEKPKNNK